MQTITDFLRIHHVGLSLKDHLWLDGSCRSLEEAWRFGSPDVVIWIATCPGILDSTLLRTFAVWSALQIRHLDETDSRMDALKYICKPYLEDPMGFFDFISKDHIARGLLAHTLDIHSKNWPKSSDLEAKVSLAIKYAVGTLSEKFCSEIGRAEVFSPSRDLRRVTYEERHLHGGNTVGISFCARAAAYLSIYALGLAVKKTEGSHEGNSCEDEAIASAKLAQANWLKANATPCFEG